MQMAAAQAVSGEDSWTLSCKLLLLFFLCKGHCFNLMFFFRLSSVISCAAFVLGSLSAVSFPRQVVVLQSLVTPKANLFCFDQKRVWMLVFLRFRVP